MFDSGKRTLAEYLYSTIDNDTYLQDTHQAILLEYAQSVLGLAPSNNSSINLEDALRFVDILSNSVGTNLSDYHHSKAQEMATLLKNIYQDNEYLQYALNKTLARTGNYTGMGNDLEEFRAETLIDQLAHNYNLEILHLPNTDSKDVFLPIQKQVFDGFSLPSLSYSAPTSMGKTFMMKTYIKNLIVNGSTDNFAILLPTKTLINEVSSELIQSLGHELEYNNYRVVTSVGSRALDGNHHYIFTVTPERLLYILGKMPNLSINYLFVDEAHKMSADESRSTYYYKVLSEIKQRTPDSHVIFASPNIPNPRIYLEALGEGEGGETSEGRCIKTDYSPVNQIQFTVNSNDGLIKVFDIGTHTFLDVCKMNAPISLNTLIDSVGRDKLNLVYCKSKSNAIQFAQIYANTKQSTSDDALLKLAKEVRDTVHEDFYLADLIEKGIAYHISYLPANIRRQLEDCYRDGKISALFCTSTLLEGVNLPAENLFITSLQKGQSNLTQVDFKNLVGRVGRIKYNLSGNVFVVALSDNTDVEVAKIEKMIIEGVPKQSLSISSGLSPKVKEHIVNTLKEGCEGIKKAKESQTNKEYDFMRKTSMVLLTDILEDRATCTKKEFSRFLDDSNLEIIKENYKDVEKLIGSDISVTVDQITCLEEAIEDGLEYPAIIANDKCADYDELVSFLKKLSEVFKWEIYEHEKLGSDSRLRFYAVLLNSWIKGNGVSALTHNAISYREKNGGDVLVEGHSFEPYDKSVRHKNFIIDDTLNTLENVILFSLSNYFLKFSEAYKRHHDVEYIDYDWYEFVEYGTTESTSIMLQRIGYQKESVQYIKKHQQQFVVIENGKLILNKQALLDCSNDLVVRDTQDIQYNFPEFFK